MDVEYVTQAEFSRRVDRSKSYINKLVKQGRIGLVDGMIPYEEGLRAFNSSGQAGYDGNRAESALRRATGKRGQSPSVAASTLSEAQVNFAYNKARSEEKIAVAQLKHLELRVRRDELIEKSDVAMDAADTAAELRSLLLSVPASVAPACEGKPAREIEALIEAGIVRAMQSLQNSVHAGGE